MRLSDDLLPHINAIAEFVYGEATPTTVRRVRHLIDHHGFPAIKDGGKITSKKSWIEKRYEQPDQPASKNGGE
jgi:hypothetical protein